MLYLNCDSGSICRFASAGKFIAQKSSVHPRRKLDHFVLLIGVSGEYPIAVEGREYLLRPDSFMLLMRGCEHYGTAPASDGQSHYWCHFYIDGDCEVSETFRKSDGCVLPEFGNIYSSAKYNMLFRQLIDAAYSNCSNENRREQICSAYTKILLYELSDEEINCGTSKLSKVAEWIRINACGHISASDVADEFHYNNDYLTHIFKAETGMTIAYYINRVRIENAKKLLLNSDYSITEIASLSGFNDGKYFMKIFKQFVNVTPSHYRSSYHMIHLNNK